MPCLSPATPADRKTEFAKLFHFFDQIASRGRSSAGKDAAGKTPSPTRSDFHDVDLIHSSASSVKTNKLKELYDATASHSHTFKRFFPTRDTQSYPGERLTTLTRGVETECDDYGGTMQYAHRHGHGNFDDYPTSPQFPLQTTDSRPFTFRHMLHKLYDKDDWFRKVQEALEHSKKEYKSLSESYVAESITEGDSQMEFEDEGVSQSDFFEDDDADRVSPPQPSPDNTQSMVETAIVFSAPPVGRNRSGKILETQIGETGPSGEMTRGSVRAVKKRCIGRRKSLSGLFGDNQSGSTSSEDQKRSSRSGLNLNAWVYDAKTSQQEHCTDNSLRKSKGRSRAVSVSNAFTDMPSVSQGPLSAGLDVSSSSGLLGVAGNQELAQIGTRAIRVRKRAATAVSSTLGVDMIRLGQKRQLER